MSKAGTDEILDLVREAGLVRPRDLESAGVPGGSLAQLAQRCLLERLGRGLYAAPGAAPSEHRSLAEVSKRTPRGVVCLLSALRFHGLTTQAPAEVWLAIGPKDRAPRPEGVRLRIVRVSGEARDAGVETHVVEGVPVRVYTAQRRPWRTASSSGTRSAPTSLSRRCATASNSAAAPPTSSSSTHACAASPA